MFSVIYFCAKVHTKLKLISKLTLKNGERHCNKLKVFFFFFLFHPLAPVSETKRSLVTHLSSVLKNPSDFSGAKNKSFFSFFFFFEYGTPWCGHTWQLNISVKGIRENGSQQSQRKRDSLHIQGPETSARVWQH